MQNDDLNTPITAEKNPQRGLTGFDYLLLLATLALFLVLVVVAGPPLLTALAQEQPPAAANQSAAQADAQSGEGIAEGTQHRTAYNDPAQHRRFVLSLVNEAREAANVPPLELFAPLTYAAQRHSDDMAEHEFLHHTGSDGSDLAVRLADEGYIWLEITETIFYIDELDPYLVFEQWFAMFESRQEMLSPQFSQVGIAYRQSPTSGLFYYTIVLAKPEALTAPGADINNPGAPTQEDQAAIILYLLNQNRLSQGMDELKINPLLTEAALIHAQDMALRDSMGHEGSDGSLPMDRVTRVGYLWNYVGENVLVRAGLHASAAFNQWWNSPSHYETMMSPVFSEIGIAYAVSSTGLYYYAMELGDPRGS